MLSSHRGNHRGLQPGVTREGSSKRHGLARTLVAAAALLVVSAGPPGTVPVRTSAQSARPSAEPTRPNIVFFLADDLDVDSVAHMPAVQRLLVARGTSFDNFLVNVPFCCPSRVTALRGQYAHNTKVFGNRPPDGGFELFYQQGLEGSTIATWLQAAGYRTFLAGKYLNGYPAGVKPTYVPPGWSQWFVTVQGRPYSQYDYTLNENGTLVAYGHRPEDYGADVTTRQVTALVEQAAKDGVPFFAFVAVHNPHGPSVPAARHEALFAEATAPRTPAFNEADVSDKPSYMRLRPALDASEIEAIDVAYRQRLRSLQSLDDLVARVTEALAGSGQLERTYTFFSSDNGYHLGDHRLAVGKGSPYEQDVHVPLIVRGPGVPEKRRLPHLVGNVDLTPTWGELAGIAVPAFVDGRSLVPLLTDRPVAEDAWRQAYLLQRGDLPRARGSGRRAQGHREPAAPAGILEPEDTLPARPGTRRRRNTGLMQRFKGLHTRTHVYVEYANGERELYDLRADPYQLLNIAASAPAGMLGALSARLTALSTCAGQACRTIDGSPLEVPDVQDPVSRKPEPDKR